MCLRDMALLRLNISLGPPPSTCMYVLAWHGAPLPKHQPRPAAGHACTCSHGMAPLSLTELDTEVGSDYVPLHGSTTARTPQ